MSLNSSHCIQAQYKAHQSNTPLYTATCRSWHAQWQYTFGMPGQGNHKSIQPGSDCQKPQRLAPPQLGDHPPQARKRENRESHFECEKYTCFPPWVPARLTINIVQLVPYSKFRHFISGGSWGGGLEVDASSPPFTSPPLLNFTASLIGNTGCQIFSWKMYRQHVWSMQPYYKLYMYNILMRSGGKEVAQRSSGSSSVLLWAWLYVCQGWVELKPGMGTCLGTGVWCLHSSFYFSATCKLCC